MATCTHAISTVSTANVTSYTSGSFTPATGDFLVAFFTATGTIITPTISDSAGGTWAQRTNVTFNGGVSTMYCCTRNQLTGNSAMTVTFDCTGDAATGCIIQVVRVSDSLGTANTTAATQEGSGTPFAGFGSNIKEWQPTIGCVATPVNPAGISPPIGWTEQDDTGFNTPNTGAEYVTRDSGFTGTTITWGSTATAPWGCIAVVVDAPEPPGREPSVYLQAVKTSSGII